MPATQFGNFKLRYQDILAEADAKNPVVPKSGRPGRTKQSHATNLILRLKEMGSDTIFSWTKKNPHKAVLRGEQTLSDYNDPMSTLTFDTHKFVKRLTAAGMPDAQAEILAEEQTRLIDERLATKDDLERMELRLTLRLSTMMAASIAIIAALVKLL